MVLNIDFIDANVFAVAFVPSKKEAKNEKDIASMKCLSKIGKQEAIGVTSQFAIIEFIGVLKTKSGKTNQYIEDKLEMLNNLPLETIYLDYRVKSKQEYMPTKETMKDILIKWNEDVKKYSFKYNLNGIDAALLMTAVDIGCTRFITWDAHFIQNPFFYGKRLPELNNILITSPDKIT